MVYKFIDLSKIKKKITKIMFNQNLHMNSGLHVYGLKINLGQNSTCQGGQNPPHHLATWPKSSTKDCVIQLKKNTP